MKRVSARTVLWVLGPLMALGLAYAARHGWVQAEGMGVWCEQHPTAAPCPWRQAVIMAFVDHRLSTTALLMAGLSGVMRLLWALRACEVFAWMGLCVAVCGLVLYDTDRSAAAALLCGLLGLASVGSAGHSDGRPGVPSAIRRQTEPSQR